MKYLLYFLCIWKKKEEKTQILVTNVWLDVEWGRKNNFNFCDEELNEIDNPEELLEEQDDDEDPQVLEEIEKR